MHKEYIIFQKIQQMQSDQYGFFWEFMTLRILGWRYKRVSSIDTIQLHIPERFVK